MSMRSPLLHTKKTRIDRAKTHSMSKALNGPIGFTEPHFRHATASPCHRRVRINQQGSVKVGCAIIELFGDISERVSRHAEYGSVVVTQLHSPSSQPSSFGNLVLLVYDPAKPLTLSNTRR